MIFDIYSESLVKYLSMFISNFQYLELFIIKIFSVLDKNIKET